MASKAAPSNKAKIARRVVEVLEYFDDAHHEATVMDIVRRYDRPQSSTSELLSSLVELGLLYKDPYSRTYSLTARAALLGSTGQPEPIRDGRLVRLIDRLLAQTGLTVALFARVGLKTQLLMIRNGPRVSSTISGELFAGMQAPLTESAAGLLLLSTVARPRCEGMVRRLNAEASDVAKFAFGDMMARIDGCRDRGHARGELGFGVNAGSEGAAMAAALIPGQPEAHPLAVGIVHAGEHTVNAAALVEALVEATAQCAAMPAPAASVERFQTAA
jgi:DNA-binding IclR family transcriptional regulator